MPKSNSAAPEIVRVFHRALDLAKENNHESITLEHLVMVMLEEKEIIDCLTALSINAEIIIDGLKTFLSSGIIGSSTSLPHPTKAVDEVITRAVGMSAFSPRTPTAIDVFLQVLQYPPEDSFAVTSLRASGLTTLAVKRYLSHQDMSSSSPNDYGDFSSPGMGMGGATISSKEDAVKLLAKYCSNFNELSIEGKIDPLIGREVEVDAIIQVMARKTKNNVVLTGEPGVGKTVLIEGLATKIVKGEVPEVIKNCVVYSLDIGSLVAGTRFRGDLEERMKQVLESLTYIDGPILFIDEIHTIMGTGSSGSQGSLDVANLLKPALSKGNLRCIGSTTLDEFRKHFEKDRALLRRFKRVDVREPDIESTKLILRGLKSYYEEFHNVTFTDAAIDAAVDLTSRYVTNGFLPDKAIDIIDNAGARQRVTDSDHRLSVIDIAQIEVEVSKVARIPEKTIKENEEEKLVRLESDLKSNVYGQDKALVALTNAVFVSRAGLREPNKPAIAVLFAGPTGSGKTESARQLAKTLGIPFLKYDMSEYMEKHSVSKLIGSPPGYVGYSDGSQGSGRLINDVDANPFCVLLLDEIEKAHEDVFNVFLQVMDDAILTSSSGKSVPFRNVYLIMTTNAGAAELSKNSIGFGKQGAGGDPTEAINRMFSPEFRNRLDATINFSRLSEDNLLMVVDKFIRLVQEMAKERSVDLLVDDDARKWIAKRGFDPAMGARPLARVIHENIKILLSRLILTGSLRHGGTATVRVENDKLIIL